MKDDSGHDRTFKRYRVNVPMLVQAADEAASPASALEDPVERLPGLAHNISLSGIGFVCAGQFDLAGLVAIEITLEAQTYLLLARVRWHRPLDLPGEPMYHYGTQFLRTEAALRFIPAAAEFLLAQSNGRRVRRGPGMTPSVTPGTVPVG